MSDAFDKRIKKHIIGKPHRFLAVAPLGFEQTLIDELKLIGVETSSTNSIANQPHIVGDGKIEFTAKITEAWKAVAYSRIANRVLMHIADFKAENFRELEKKASEIPWELYLDERREPKDERYLSSNSINIHVTCKHSRLYHSDAIAERLYNVIAQSNIPQSEASSEGKARPHTPWFDRLTNRFIAVASEPTHQNLYVNFLDDRCTIWQDLAGEELYKRGFERFVNDAPLKETIASAMIFEAFYTASLTTNHQPLATIIDPMSGSGTFSLEAASIAHKIIPGVSRDFALKHQPAFKEATWNFLIRQETRDDKCVGRVSRPCLHEHDRVQHLGLERSDNPKTNGATATITKIITSDISERAIEIIKHNVDCSPLASIEPKPITPQIRDFFSYTAKEIADACGEASPIIVLNPPYGKRLDFDAPKLYTKIGRKLTEFGNDLKQFHKELTVAILAPKDDTHVGSKYTCTSNLLRECSALSPKNNPTAKQIVTSHGGFSLNVFIAKV